MKRLEVRLTREPGQERVVGQLAETARWPVHAHQTGMSAKSIKGVEKTLGTCLAALGAD